MWKSAILVLLIATSCSAQKMAGCTNTATETKNMIGETKTEHICKCECPQPSSNIIDAGGIVGGLINLFSSNN